MAALKDAVKAQSEGDSAHAAHLKHRYSRLLYRLAPGRVRTVQAICSHRGTHLRQPAEMAEELRSYWSTVFTRIGIQHSALEAWLADDAAFRATGPISSSQYEDTPPSHAGLNSVRVSSWHIKKAIQRSGNSAVGPDGIPYAAWRTLSDEAVPILVDALNELTGIKRVPVLDPNQVMDKYCRDFNESLMVFLPKTPVPGSPSDSPAYYPSAVRPLNVSNTDNRILASAVRMAVEPKLGPLITNRQRGFIHGRSMIANLLDVEESMYTTAATGSGGLSFFFDFEAAFPSVEHDSLHGFFAYLGWPSWLLQFIRCLYRGNICRLSLGGSLHQGFELIITRGIRQGCPLSPLLFAALSDLYLRRLDRLFPRSTIRAWADDPDAAPGLPALRAFFEELRSVTGLKLHPSKTVAVPLDPRSSWPTHRAGLRQLGTWALFRMEGYTKYLGFMLGPERAEHSWDAPLEKFLDRARLWGRLGAGLFLTGMAYTIYIASVLMFVGQLEPLPSSFVDYEKRACAALLPGPGNWISVEALKGLSSLGFPWSLRGIPSAVLASKARVYEYEAAGRLHIWTRAYALKNLVTTSADFSRVA